MDVVLVTGGAGYIGSHVCKALAKTGFLPVTYDDLSTGFKWAVKWGPLILGTLDDKGLLEKICIQKKPIAVMHFAARTDARKCHKEPFPYYHTNVCGTLNLLEIVKKLEIPHFIFSSTCAVYGMPIKIPIDETHPTHPINVYGETKLIGEKLVRQLSHTNVAILRYFNAAGADPDGELGESHAPATHLIPLLINIALKRQREFSLFGNDHPTEDGTPIRDYIHVSDLADAHVRALIHLMRHQDNLILNLGTGRGLSVREVLSAFESHFGLRLPLKVQPKDPADPPCLYAESSAAQKILNWKIDHSRLSTIFETSWRWQAR